MGMVFAMGQLLIMALCVSVVTGSMGQTVNTVAMTRVPSGRGTIAMGTVSAPMMMRGEVSAPVRMSTVDTTIVKTSNLP